MYGQILTNKSGKTVKILSHHQDIYIISNPNDHTNAIDRNYTKQDLIALGWIFPVEKWTPERGMTYFIPHVSYESKYDFHIWTNDELGNLQLANNLVCRTKEEAIALTDKMLGAVTNKQINK